MIDRLRNILRSSDPRSALIKKNIIGSFGLKAFDILIDFILVPLSLSYLTQTNYGIWLTINSMVNWMGFFDVGIGHGLRNKLAIALSNKDYELAKTYTSTAYGIIALISTAILLVMILIVPFVNWQYLLNINSITNDELRTILVVVFGTFSINLTLKILTSIFLANQMPAFQKATETLSKLVVLIGVLVLFYINPNYSLLYYALVFSLSPVIVLLTISFVIFKFNYKAYSPSFKNFDRSKISDLMGLGLKFFVIQIGFTMLFMTDNIIISHTVSVSEVAPYQIILKYFGILLILFNIISGPYWSAITEAYAKNEIVWIRNSIKSLNKIWAVFLVLVLIMIIFFKPFFQLWIGDDIDVPLLLVLQASLFVIFQTQNSIYTMFLNGTGKITIQMWTSIVTLVMNVPLSFIFAVHFNLGSAGVLLATNCSLLLYVVTRRIQYGKIINGNAKGVWDK